MITIIINMQEFLMKHFCPHHRSALRNNPSMAAAAWRKLIDSGTEHHQKRAYVKSCEFFSAGEELSCMLLGESANKDMVTMRVISSHNLAASLMAAGDCLKAEQTLIKLHKDIVHLCEDNEAVRSVRLEALAQLETSLFSLSSQLSYTGKVEDLHELIASTEQVAELTAQQLFH